VPILGAIKLVNYLKCLHNSAFSPSAFVSWRPSHAQAIGIEAFSVLSEESDSSRNPGSFRPIGFGPGWQRRFDAKSRLRPTRKSPGQYFGVKTA
jgi:hypothetical protein